MLATGGNAIRINIHKRRVSYRLVLATNNTAVAGSLRRWAMRCLSQANLHPAASLLVPDPPFWVLSKELGAHGHWQIKWRGFTELLQMFTDSVWEADNYSSPPCPVSVRLRRCLFGWEGRHLCGPISLVTLAKGDNVPGTWYNAMGDGWRCVPVVKEKVHLCMCSVLATE